MYSSPMCHVWLDTGSRFWEVVVTGNSAPPPFLGLAWQGDEDKAEAEAEDANGMAVFSWPHGKWP